MTPEEIALYCTPPAIDESLLCCQLRHKRDEYIDALDKIVSQHRRESEMVALELLDATTYTQEQYASVLVLIQELCELPDQAGFPCTCVWPTIPAFLQSKFEGL